jgi:putative folate metabolism gamma-glutamate ligase
MIVTPFKTKAVVVGDSLLSILKNSLPKLSDGDILVVTSKIVSICEGAVVKNDGSVNKHDLIKQEADTYLDVPLSQAYGVTITIKDNKLVANAGIDESNGNGYFILWPRDAFASATILWNHLRQKYSVQNLGVIITDSHIMPLQWGTRGRAIAWCGIEPLKNYIGSPDIFGHNLHVTKASIIDGLAAAAVTVMGEGNEQTPLAVIKDVPFVTFVNHPPSKKEIDALTIKPADDIYAPLLTSVQWKI